MGKKPKPIEDEEQSRRFMESVRELEAAGELSHTEAVEMMDRVLKKDAVRRQE